MLKWVLIGGTGTHCFSGYLVSGRAFPECVL